MEAVARLVEQEDLRLMHKCERQAKPLALALRQSICPALDEVAQAEPHDGVVDRRTAAETGA